MFRLAIELTCVATLCSLFLACASPSSGSVVDGLEKDSHDTVSITVARAGVFTEYGERVASAIHYGFTDENAPGWTAAGEVPIVYEDGLSLAATVEVFVENDEKILAYVIFYEDGTYGQRTAGVDQFIDLAAPGGTMVELPVQNSASYPFALECYGITVNDATEEGNGVRFPGILNLTYYGFTAESFEAYEDDNNVPWENVLGELVAEGVMHPSIRHDGGYYGSYALLPEWIRVPEGKNLVFKLNFNKFDGHCPSGNDTRFIEATNTKTYFVAVP